MRSVLFQSSSWSSFVVDFITQGIEIEDDDDEQVNPPGPRHNKCSRMVNLRLRRCR